MAIIVVMQSLDIILFIQSKYQFIKAPNTPKTSNYLFEIEPVTSSATEGFLNYNPNLSDLAGCAGSPLDCINDTFDTLEIYGLYHNINDIKFLSLPS